MSDYIKREDAIEIIARHDDTDGTIKVFSGRFVNGLISAIPTADVVEVVRCKDCKHLYQDNECPLRLWFVHTENDFCSYGERADT